MSEGAVVPLAVVLQINQMRRQRADINAPPPLPPVEPDFTDKDLAGKPLTDLGNAERFAARNRGKLIHVSALGWLAWDSKRWAHDDGDNAVSRAVHETVRHIQDEAEAIRGTESDYVVDTKKDGTVVWYSDKVAAWGRSSESASRLAAIARHAAPYLAVDVAALDADPWRLNVLNGTIHVVRQPDDSDPVVFKAHDPRDLITKLAPVVFNPEASAPAYDRFLADVQPIGAVRRFLHQWGGYSLTGDTREQKLCFFYGKGRNGKSTLVDSWGHVAGDYGETVPIETFLDQGKGRNAGAATPDLALLPGVRFLRTSEPERGANLAESLIKLMTGGEPIQARHLNKDYFKYRPAFKLTMSGNYRPDIKGADEGIWRRVMLVPWSVTVDVPDPDLSAKLKTEASGILNRLLDGLRDYMENGLVIPPAVAEATSDYREDSDPLGRFLKACVEHVPGSTVQSILMHKAFTIWARNNGEKEWSAKGLTMALKERGYVSGKVSSMFWRDCRLSAGALIDPDDPLSDGRRTDY